MKQILITLILMGGFFATFNVAAITPSSPAAAISAGDVMGQMTVNDFLAFDAKAYRSADGKKMKWTERLAISIVKKKLERKVNKGKIEGTATMAEATKAASASKYGLLSLILSAAGVILLFTPLGLVGMIACIAGFVLGLIGLKRDTNTTMALIGTILGAVGIFITLLAVILVASFLSGF